MCDFCCLIDFEFCSRDIGICEPVIDRNLGIIVDCVKVLGGIVLGFPIIIFFCKLLIIHRCCSKCFRDELGGVSCYELFFRILCCLKCTRFSETFPMQNDLVIADKSRGLIYYALCCCLFPSFISSKFETSKKESHNEEGEDVEMEEGEGEEGEEGEEEDADN